MVEIPAGAARGKRVEFWFQDEARIAQKNKITRRWARYGMGPSVPHDQRTSIFGAIYLKLGKAAALVMLSCHNPRDDPASDRNLSSSPGTHHHSATAAEVSELNLVENLWQFIRQNWL